MGAELFIRDDSTQKPNYPYNASEVAAIVFAFLFLLGLIVHLWQAVRARVFWMWPMLVGVLLEVIGYATRYLAAKNEFTKKYLTISQICIIIAPAFFAAEDYLVVGRMMSYVGTENSLIRAELITWVFVLSDIVTFFTQIGGASLLQNDSVDKVKTGKNILIAGLVIQVISFFIFIFVTIAFHRKASKNLGAKLNPLRRLFAAFYISAVLIVIRGIYRTIEFGSLKFNGTQQTGYITVHEWVFYVFDSLLIICAVYILNIWHPTKFLPQKKGLRLDGAYEESSGGCCGGRGKVRNADPNGAAASGYNNSYALRNNYQGQNMQAA